MQKDHIGSNFYTVQATVCRSNIHHNAFPQLPQLHVLKYSIVSKGHNSVMYYCAHKKNSNNEPELSIVVLLVCSSSFFFQRKKQLLS